jgi:hypothetical protein
MNTLSKLIEYAYPTSTKAVKAGFGSTGCWYVALYPDIDASFGGMPLPETFSNDKAKVKAIADKMPEPYNKNNGKIPL